MSRIPVFTNILNGDNNKQNKQICLLLKTKRKHRIKLNNQTFSTTSTSDSLHKSSQKTLTQLKRSMY